MSRWRLLRRNLDRPENGRLHPTMVQVQTINRCNGACRMCPYPETVALRESQAMDEGLFDRIVQELASFPGRGILVFGFQSEPFLDERLEGWIRRARAALDRRWIVEVTTNGSLLDEDRVRRLAEAAPDLLSVSLNALTEATYSRVMPGLSWVEVNAGVERILSLNGRIPLALRHVILEQNIREYGSFRRRWHRRGVPVIGFECNNRIGALASYEELRPRDDTALTAFVKRVLSPVLRGVCLFPFAQLNILANGDVLACCNDYRADSVAGRLPAAGIVDVFNSEYFRTLRAASRNGGAHPLCGRCSLRRHNVAPKPG